MTRSISESDIMASGKESARPADEYYRAMAEFRHQIRRFIRFSEEVAQGAGVEPQQHLLMLSIRGLPGGVRPTIRNLAERLMLRHHSVVELVDRSERMGLVRRMADRDDRRQVLVGLTPKGERILRRIFAQNSRRLRAQSHELSDALAKIAREQRAARPRRR
jgi:DNA-binding MarR family transcriptional regulator